MKVNSLIKKVALVLAGVAAITAVGFGVKAIVDYTNEDLKTVSLSYEVGSLGSDGKYVEDEGSIYTKEAFACYGLQVKPDFDAQVEYQIYYYDILDSYISCTDVLTESFCEEAPLNGAYARIVITPTDDEDGEIGFIEKYTYANQLTVKVYKEQDMDTRYQILAGRVLQLVPRLGDVYFEVGLSLSDDVSCWEEKSDYACMTTYIKVSGGSTISVDGSYVDSSFKYVTVFQFSELPLSGNFIRVRDINLTESTSLTLESKTKYIIIRCCSAGVAWSASDVANLPSCFSISE